MRNIEVGDLVRFTGPPDNPASISDDMQAGALGIVKSIDYTTSEPLYSVEWLDQDFRFPEVADVNDFSGLGMFLDEIELA